MLNYFGIGLINTLDYEKLFKMVEEAKISEEHKCTLSEAILDNYNSDATSESLQECINELKTLELLDSIATKEMINNALNCRQNT